MRLQLQRNVQDLRSNAYRRLLAATFLQKIRGGSSHDVWVVHALHQTGLDMSGEERLLPLVWSLRNPPNDHPGILRPLKESALTETPSSAG